MIIFNHFTNLEEIKSLHDEGYWYGSLLRLQAISELSSKSITEILQINNVVTIDENEEKQINFETIIEATGIKKDNINDLLKDYRAEAKDYMKNQLAKVKEIAVQRHDRFKENNKQRDKENQQL